MREVHDPALCGAVNCVLPMRIEAGHRGRVDDDAAAVFLHQRSREAGAENHGLKIDLNHQMPSLWWCVREAGCTDADAGVVVQDVEAAELRDRGFEHPARVFEPGYVGLDEDGASARAFDALDGFSPAGLVEIRDHDRRTFAGEALRGCAPDSR